MDGKAVAGDFAGGVVAVRVGQLSLAKGSGQAAAVDVQLAPGTGSLGGDKGAWRGAPVHIDTALIGLAQGGQGVVRHAPDDIEAVFGIRLFKGGLDARDHGIVVAGEDHHRLALGWLGCRQQRPGGGTER